MRTFEEWGQLENKKCKVIINHTLFGRKQYDCDVLQVINDEHRIGVVIKGRELFVYKQDVEDLYVCDNTYTVKDKMMTISIVNKL